MERDEDGWPGYGPGADGSGADGSAADDDRAPYDYWDGRLTNEDFVNRPPEAASQEAASPEAAPREPARPLYDGRPIRDPYDRGGGYRRVSDAVWDQAREDYLAGEAAEMVCARHGLALSTFRQRARAQGWRRIDQPDPEPVDLEAEEEAGLPDYAQMARHALVRLNRAVLRGRAAEAAGWMRLHMRLSELARAAEATPAPQPAPKPAPKPAKTPDPQATAMAKARTVQTLVRAVADLDPADATGRRLIDKSLEVLDALERAPISDDSHHSDGVFADAESGTPADASADPP
jgi:hypothetical protein